MKQLFAAMISITLASILMTATARAESQFIDETGILSVESVFYEGEYYDAVFRYTDDGLFEFLHANRLASGNLALSLGGSGVSLDGHWHISTKGFRSGQPIDDISYSNGILTIKPQIDSLCRITIGEYESNGAYRCDDNTHGSIRILEIKQTRYGLAYIVFKGVSSQHNSFLGGQFTVSSVYNRSI